MTSRDREALSAACSEEEHSLAPKMDVVAEFACPFCGGEVTIGEMRASGNATACHVVPTCEVFDRCDPGEFVAKCHRAVFGEVARA